MATYNSDLAQALKERYLLANSTIRNWKYRQQIPDRYLEGYVTRLRAPEQHTEIIKQWLRLPFIRRTRFEGIRPTVLNDLMRLDDGRKHARLRDEEAKTILQQLRILDKRLRRVANDPQQRYVKLLFDTPLIYIRPLVGLPDLYQQLMDRKDKARPEDLIRLQTQIQNLLTTLPPLPNEPAMQRREASSNSDQTSDE